MNKLTLTIALILSNLLIIAQCDDSCLPEGITFTTQEEIDNFQTNYPGCTEIEGDVIINAWNNNFPVTDLGGLSVLTSIGGDLIIAGNDSLTSLAGLDNITSIGGNLGIGYFFGWEAFGNYSLNSLNSLENITSIGGDLVIILNYSLLSLSGLENLTSVPGNLIIEANNTLTSLADLENLTSVGGSLSIFANPELSNLIGLENLTSIEEDFYLNYNVSLINLNGLENLTSVDGSFHIIENVLLINLIGLENLAYIGTILNIVNNNNLTSLTGLENLETISGNLRIKENNSLLNLNGLENLTSVGGSISIWANPELSNLIGLENLTSIGGSLVIQENPSLTSIASLENLSMIGSLYISDNSALSMCAIESICNYLGSPNGSTIIENNGPFCNSQQEVTGACFGWPNGITFSSQQQIDLFQNLFPDCIEIVGDLKIGAYSGTDITNISGLSQLTSIGGDLLVWNNNNLTSLTGLENVEANSIGGLGIYNNLSLTTCEAQNICDYLTSPNGTVNIYNNAVGCNSPQDIAFACGNALSCLPFGNYYFYSQADIDNFGNYADCSELEGTVRISGIDINNLNGLNSVASCNGDLFISENSILADLSGFDNLASIGGDFTLENNPALVNLSGLGNLETISEKFRIVNNDSLVNFMGADSLSSIGEYIDINDNDALASLIGLENLSFIGGVLEIKNNNSLSICAITSICDYLTSPNGAVNIYNNAPGCNSIQQVQDSCNITSVEKEKINSDLTISPNPTNDQAILSLNLSTSASVNIWLCNTAGICLKSWQFSNEQPGNKELILDLKETQAGIYFCRIQVGNEMITKKIIKL